jgi:hypothetical protein
MAHAAQRMRVGRFVIGSCENIIVGLSYSACLYSTWISDAISNPIRGLSSLGKALEEAIPDLIHGDAQSGQFQNITGADP